MPIRPNFSVSPGLALGTAFATGRGNRQAMRDEFRLKQAQLAEQSRQFNLGLLSRQQMANQGMQFDLYRQNLNAAQQAALANQAMRNRTFLGDRAFAQRGMLDMAGDARRAAMYDARDERAVAAANNERRSHIGSMVNGVAPDGSRMFDPTHLNDTGKKLLGEIQNDLEQLDPKLETSRPRDSAIALSRIEDKARKLTSPIYQMPPQQTMPEMYKAETMVDPNTGATLQRLPNNQGWKELSKKPTSGSAPGPMNPEELRPIATGGVIHTFGPDGKETSTTNYADLHENMLEKAITWSKAGGAPWQKYDDTTGAWKMAEGGQQLLDNWINQQTMLEWNRTLHGPDGEMQPGQPGQAAGQPAAAQQSQPLSPEELQLINDRGAYRDMLAPYSQGSIDPVSLEKMGSLRGQHNDPDSNVPLPTAIVIDSPESFIGYVNKLNEITQYFSAPEREIPAEAALLSKAIAEKIREYRKQHPQ